MPVNICDNQCIYYLTAADAIQPERLNAEGEARVLLAEGGALAQPSDCQAPMEKRLKDAKAAAVICADHHK